MKKYPVISATALCLFALTAQANVVHDQAWDGTGEVYSSQEDPIAYGDFAKVYDNFTLASAGRITNVHWTGGYIDLGSPGNITRFLIEFWSDNAGSPGSVLFSENITGDAGETFVAVIDQTAVHTYNIALSTSFLATSGTQYWLSIQPTLEFPLQWGWATSTGGDGIFYQDFLGERFQEVSDTAFGLTVPEPATVFLMGLGLAGMGWKSRRKASI